MHALYQNLLVVAALLAWCISGMVSFFWIEDRFFRYHVKESGVKYALNHEWSPWQSLWRTLLGAVLGPIMIIIVRSVDPLRKRSLRKEVEYKKKHFPSS